MARIWLNGKGGKPGRYIDGWVMPKEFEKVLRNMAVEKAINEYSNEITDKEKNRIHRIVWSYSAQLLAGMVKQKTLEAFANSLGYTSEQIKPVIRGFVKRGSKADLILFDVSVWD